MRMSSIRPCTSSSTSTTPISRNGARTWWCSPTPPRRWPASSRSATVHGVPFVPRGGGTNLSGGTIPFKGGVVIEMIRMNRLLEVDPRNLRARVQPGMFNLELGNALAPLGYQFLPDPASQKAATLGGNVAENSGGPHCFKYGVTTNHVEGLTVVLPDGEIAEFGGMAPDAPGYDLTGVFVGSEGTFGVCTEVVVRIVRLRRRSEDDAGHLRQHRAGQRNGFCHRGGRHGPGDPRDDGPAGDPGRGAVHPLRPARGLRDGAHHRDRWAEG